MNLNTLATQKGTILVADDDPANLRLLSDLLRAEGYQVRAAKDGEQVLKSARLSPPDLVLLDVHMPRLDGYEACQALKKEESLCEIPVLFLSGLSEPFNRTQAFQAGAVDFITKPFESTDVLQRIGVHLNLRRLHQELEQRNVLLDAQQKWQNQLFLMIAHDMRSPLTTVLTSLELMGDSVASCPDWMSEVVADATVATSRITNMIDDLLRVRDLENGTLMPNLQDKVSLSQLLDDFLRLIEKGSRARVNIQVSGNDRMTLRCDPSLIQRILINLAENALRYSPMNESIVIRVSEGDESHVRFDVEDKGPGVPPEDEIRIFDKHFTTNRSNGSSGLGLAFCKLAIEAQNGHIGVASGAERGAHFWFDCPIGSKNDS